MELLPFGDYKINFATDSVRTDGAYNIVVQYGISTDYTITDTTINIGGCPLALVYLTEGLLDQTSNPSQPTYKRVYALQIIEKTLTTPITSTEFSGTLNSVRLAFSQDSDGKIYLNIDKETGNTEPYTEIILQGIPLICNSDNELIMVDSGYTTDEIDSYSSILIGGIPSSIGRIGNKWYLIVSPI